MFLTDVITLRKKSKHFSIIGTTACHWEAALLLHSLLGCLRISLTGHLCTLFTPTMSNLFL